MERQTIQRRAILDVVERLHHSTVDEIFEESKKDIPTLSFSTVYRNLVVLEEDKLLRRIPNIIGKDLYESTSMNRHSHFICLECGKVVDVGNGKRARKVYDKDGNLIYESAKISYGVCKDCLEKKH